MLISVAVGITKKERSNKAYLVTLNRSSPEGSLGWFLVNKQFSVERDSKDNLDKGDNA